MAISMKCVWGVSLVTALALSPCTTTYAQTPWARIPAPTVPRPSAPVPEMPPALPEHAKAVRSMTLEVSIRHDGAGSPSSQQRQTVTRTASRVHVRQDSGREWLYVQNPRDRSRVSGWLVDHVEETIVHYDESELRNWQGVRGWLDVLTLGVDLRAVTGVPVPLVAKDLEGLTFVRHDRRRSGREPDQVWWCEDQLLPLEVVRQLPQGSTVVLVERIRLAIAPELLDSPETRFPGYRSLDLAEWLEDR